MDFSYAVAHAQTTACRLMQNIFFTYCQYLFMSFATKYAGSQNCQKFSTTQ